MTDDIALMPVIDVDTHWTEPPDLWTSRAPAKFRDRALRVHRNDDGVDVRVDSSVLECQRIHEVEMQAVMNQQNRVIDSQIVEIGPREMPTQVGVVIAVRDNPFAR